jgi:hypothetical protein
MPLHHSNDMKHDDDMMLTHYCFVVLIMKRVLVRIVANLVHDR